MDSYFDNIQDYLDKTLNAAEKQRFEEELSKNKALKAAVNTQKEIMTTVSAHIKAEKGINNLKATLSENNASYFEANDKVVQLSNRRHKKNKIRTFTVAIGAAACLVIGLAYFNVFSPRLNKLPRLQTETVRGQADKTNINNAIKAFNNKDFEKSIRLFSNLSNREPKVIRFKFYLGLSYIGAKKWKKATTTLKPIADRTSLYKDKSAYFTALAFSKQGDGKLARKYAGLVAKESSYYHKAQRLIK